LKCQEKEEMPDGRSWTIEPDVVDRVDGTVSILVKPGAHVQNQEGPPLDQFQFRKARECVEAALAVRPDEEKGMKASRPSSMML
jgi:hypothetical protein